MSTVDKACHNSAHTSPSLAAILGHCARPRPLSKHLVSPGEGPVFRPFAIDSVAHATSIPQSIECRAGRRNGPRGLRLLIVMAALCRIPRIAEGRCHWGESWHVFACLMTCHGAWHRPFQSTLWRLPTARRIAPCGRAYVARPQHSIPALLGAPPPFPAAARLCPRLSARSRPTPVRTDMCGAINGRPTHPHTPVCRLSIGHALPLVTANGGMTHPHTPCVHCPLTGGCCLRWEATWPKHQLNCSLPWPPLAARRMLAHFRAIAHPPVKWSERTACKDECRRCRSTSWTSETAWVLSIVAALLMTCSMGRG